VHVTTEALKLAFADRDSWYGDSVEVPLADLLTPTYAAARRTLIGETASLELRPGAPGGRNPRLPPHPLFGTMERIGAGAGEPTMAPTLDRHGEPALTASGAQRGDTCHVDTVDRWGNMLAATPSGGWFQSSPVIPELGFGLSVRGQMFWLKDGFNASLAPGKRPRTTLTPSFAFRDGKPYLAFGTPGGDQQEQWQLQMFLRHAEHGMNLQEAIDTPSFSTDDLIASFWPREVQPGSLAVEGRFPAATVAELERRGHVVSVRDAWSQGRLSAVAREPDGNAMQIKAAANPRGMQAYAIAR
jgi:gamma-glutamyltranspeptidase / glutathione hydrolase